jgi:carbamate kinase
MTQLRASFGWQFLLERAGYRRVVPSPIPRHIREIDAIRILLNAGIIVICSGGGGVPVSIDAHSGAILGVEAVVDKDRSAALLASELGADTLLILTDVPAAFTDWGTSAARAIRHATPSGLKAHSFMPGSMGPKIEAACRFVVETGGTAHIGALADAAAVLRGETGTHIELRGDDLNWY